MEKILATFKKLYAGEDKVKKHLTFSLLLIIPAIMTALANILQLIVDNKEAKTELIVILVAVAFLFILFIPVMIFLTGYTLKYINGRHKGEVGIPSVDWDCFAVGIKAIPFYLAWMFYVCTPMLIFIGVLIYMIVKATSGGDPISMICAFVAFIGALILFYIALIVYSPFYCHVYIKYAKTLTYSADLFNPLKPFQYMGMAFKDTMITCLKYLVVSLVFAFVVQIVNMIFCGIGMVFLFLGSMASALSFVGYTFGVLIISIGSIISMYGQMMVTFAYTDNLIEVHKEKIEPIENDALKYKDERLDI